MSRRFVRPLAALVFFALFASRTAAQDLTFTPVADAGINYAETTRNFGSDDLRVEWDRHTVWRNVERSFMRFEVSGVQGQGYDCVTLRLHATNGGDSHFEVRLVRGAWGEDGVTWETQPPTGAVVGSWTESVSTGDTIEIPLSDTLARFDGTVELALIGIGYGGGDDIRFQSREDGSPPELVFGCNSAGFGAGFSTPTREGPVPLRARFQNVSSGDATSWTWDFGDGNTATTKGALHTYTTPGRYTVTLTSHGPRGSSTQVRPNYVFAHPADSDLGSVHDWQRLSQVRGGATPPLDEEDMFGRSVDVLGDLDGDGVVDLIVGALGDDDAPDENGEDAAGRFDDNRANNPGAAYVLFMQADGRVRAHQKISNLYGNLGVLLDDEDGFGRYVAGIGDLDGDGVLDAVVTACRDDDGGSNQGAFYVLFLNPDGTVRDRTKVSETTGGFGGRLDNNDQFGRGVTSLGDLDGDGIQDLAIGAINDDDGGGDRGAVWILYMNRDGTVRDEAKIGGDRAIDWDGRWFGMDVDLLGDVNGDGIPDIGVGVLLDDSWLHASGGAFVLLLNRDGSVKGEYYIDAFEGMVTGELEAGDEFGGSVAGIGDLDGDGVPDMAVGSIRDDDNGPGDLEIGTDTGAVYVYLLNSDGSVKGYQKISGTRGNLDDRIDRYDRFGEGLGAGGDLNGDGIPDLLAGSRFDDDGGANKGSVRLLYLNDGSLQELMADFTATPRSGDVPLAVQFEDSSFGAVTAWSWDFGDGSSSSAAAPVHTYTAPGTWDVTLTVTGPDGISTHTLSDHVVTTPGPAPVAGFRLAPEMGVAPLTVDFEDRSVGFVTSWNWEFGDGTSASGANPTHTFALPGTWSVRLTTTGPGGADTLVLDEAVVVGEASAPSAGFSFDVATGEAPLAVSFRNVSLGAVETLTWDFGDGGMSTERHPSHVYTAAGSYDVSLTASGPLGSDTLTLASAIVVTAASAPVAAFTAAPTSGLAPLSVVFSDASSGPITARTWDFGDGAMSNALHPNHVYTLPGTYGVTLTVTGPGGTDANTQVDLVTVGGTVPMGLLDGGFEAQAAGVAPVSPWSTLAGLAHVVSEGGPDAGFPTEGSRWLELSNAGAGAGQAPTRPGNFTLPALAGAGVAQTFRLPAGETTLRFEASFLLGGSPASLTDNDWMSVDVSDGQRTLNLFHADSFSAFPQTSDLHGLPATAVTSVEVDLSQAFVGSDGTTDFVLTLQVGDGGGGGTPSLGRVDGVRLEATLDNLIRFGCGLNPVGSLVVLEGQPLLGGSMTLGIDNPFATQTPGSGSFLMLAFNPDAAFPCGTVFGGVGMSGGAGELLVSRVAPDPARIVVGPPWGGSGFPARINTALPSDLGLVGTTLYAQGYLFDTTPGTLRRIGLTDALQLVLTAPGPVENYAPGLEAAYYDQDDFSDLVLTRVDPTVDFSWGTGSPDPAVGAETFSVRWSGFVEAPFTGDYTFTTTSDDGVRLWVGGVRLVDDWTDHAPREGAGTLTLQGGERTPLLLEYYENGGGATMRLEWEAAGLAREVVPEASLSHATD